MPERVNTAVRTEIVFRHHLIELIELQLIFTFANFQLIRLYTREKNTFLVQIEQVQRVTVRRSASISYFTAPQ